MKRKKIDVVKDVIQKYGITEDDISLIIESTLPSVLKKQPSLKLKIKALLEDSFVTKEEVMALLEELKKQREDFSKRFEAMDRRFEEMRKDMNVRFEAMDRRFEMLTKEMKDGFKILNNSIIALGARWGIFAEEAFRQSMSDILKELSFENVQKWREYDADGYVFGFPTFVEVDLVIKDGKHYLIEIKSSVSEGDVLKLKRLGEFYERKYSIKPELIIISPFIREEAKARCEELEIKFYRKE